MKLKANDGTTLDVVKENFESHKADNVTSFNAINSNINTTNSRIDNLEILYWMGGI